jgi:aspartate aminotransferase-like enzyme
MFRKTRLFTPGPTPLVPAAQFAMAAADIHHRTPEFRALFSRTLAKLQQFVGTSNEVIALTSSGTGAMEAAVVNFTSPGDKVLVLTAGKFGERWSALTKTYGLDITTVTRPYGETFVLDEIKAALTPEIRAVFVQATETSTGIRHDISAIAKLTRASNALLVVDGITGLGTTHIDVDADGIDVLIGGSQKALMIPAGLAYLAISERAWKRAAESRQPRFYFDLLKERKNQAKGETSYTPATALFAGLDAALDYIGAQAGGDVRQGAELLVDNAERNAAATRAAVKALGLELFAPASPSAAVTAVKAPEGLDSGAIIKGLKGRFGSIIANGQGEMKGKLFRIAHIGYFDYLDTIALIGALEFVLAELAPGKFQLGDGLRAAQQYYGQALPNEGK